MSKVRNNSKRTLKTAGLKASDMAALRKRMPPGYTVKAVELLKAKGFTCSPEFVVQQFTKPSNIRVIDVLCEIAEANEAEIARVAARVRGRVPAKA